MLNTSPEPTKGNKRSMKFPLPQWEIWSGLWPGLAYLVVVSKVEILHQILPVSLTPGRPVARPAPERVPGLEVLLLLELADLPVPHLVLPPGHHLPGELALVLSWVRGLQELLAAQREFYWRQGHNSTQWWLLLHRIKANCLHDFLHYFNAK